jgi:8-oxo-dGTP pyrophosphatase MutT (NUDIX family)
MNTPLSTVPNSGIPVGLRRKDANDDAVKAAKGHAAGILFVAPDGDVLLLRRSSKEANFAGHWALPGGGVEEDETPEEGALREAREEMGWSSDEAEPRLIDQKMTPTGLAFHTFACPVKDKFIPHLNGEHSGYAWAPLNMLPRPMHPAVEGMLNNRLGMSSDMKPEEWSGLVGGLLKFLGEEAEEPEHMASDALALDESVRTEDVDGRMRVAMMNVSKSNVCPYKGSEIPQSDELGLDPERVYYLYRDPQELAKAAPSTNGVQILRKHIPINSEDHQPWDVVGAMGTDGNFEYPYLRNSATFWVADDIEAIKSGKRRQISMGYHYIPIMEPGVADGVPFDGRMTNIVTNHFAMVEDGRAGPDVMVADEAPDAKEWRLIAEAIASL